MNCVWLSKPPDLWPLHGRIKIALSDIIFTDVDGKTYIHKRGYPTDGATIPNILTSVWDPYDRQIIRSVLQHDIQYTLHDFDINFMQTRRMVDLRFYRSLKCEGWKYDHLWYVGVRMFGKYIWTKMSSDPDARAWYEATKQGELAIDEWIKKCIENPRSLEAVKYYDQIQNDLLRYFNRAYNDLRGFKQWYFSTDRGFALD